MPSGIYERKPWMRNAGLGPEVHAAIKEMLACGYSLNSTARYFGVTRSTVLALRRGQWNPYRDPGAMVSLRRLQKETRDRISRGMKLAWKRRRKLEARGA